jgi:cytochrome c2
MKNLLFISFLLFFGPLLLHAQTDAAAGKSIFQSRCASCHSLKQEMTGPALKDVDKRRKPEWIVKFVQSSQTMISSGDADAKAVFAKYQTIMPDHKDLKEADVQNIIAFVKEESARLDKEAANNPIKRPKESLPNNKPLVWATEWWVFVVYGFFLFLLVYALSFVINANELKNKKTSN